MELDDYQKLAALTDQGYGADADHAITLCLLGVAGETGSLLSEFKKKLRDGEAYEGFTDRAKEELGDVLWYVGCVATRLGLSLNEIAAGNLRKTQERWPIGHTSELVDALYDEDFPSSEQLPRIVRVEVSQDGQTGSVRMIADGVGIVGDRLTDNAYEDDGYRFHDVFHLAHLAVLGWSPVMRRLLSRKRKSNPTVDEVEDGARAAIIEELIVAFVYSNARERKLYAGAKHLDSELLANIKRMVSHLEVRSRRTRDWEVSILQGYRAFRHLLKKKAGVLVADMTKRELRIER